MQRQVAPETLESAGRDEHLEQLLQTLKTLFESMRLDAPEWRATPARDALPMMPLLPGI